jgi:ABC-2 type transport system permease protein
VRALAAQLRVELTLTFRNGESLLLTLAIPVAVLVFFTVVDVLPIEGDPVDFLAPGTLALAVLATAPPRSPTWPSPPASTGPTAS